MIFSCEECGKKYKVNPEKIPGDKALFKCPNCGHVNTVTKPPPTFDVLPDEFITDADTSAIGIANAANRDVTKDLSHRKGIAFGLRKKMILFFVLVPVVMMAAVSYFYMSRMLSLSGLITNESSDMVTKMAESVIADKARSAAKDSKRYIDTHPALGKENFNKDPAFKEIAIQKVGETGYTCLVEKPNPREPISKLWVHPIEKLIGVDIDAAMKKTLGKDFQRWYDITQNAFAGNGQEAAGYYMWYDKREKYMVMTPVEGTDFFIASTTYLDEFTQPVKELQQRADNITRVTFRTVIVLLVFAALLIGAVSFIYANRISGNIQKLTDITDRMSVGDLNVEIQLKSKDELGVLAEAISRMQTSIRFALDRIKQKR